MRSLWILLVAACLLAGCEEVPTTPAAGSQQTTATSSNQQSSTTSNQQSSTGQNAEGTIKDGKVSVTLPDGEMVYN